MSGSDPNLQEIVSELLALPRQAWESVRAAHGLTDDQWTEILLRLRYAQTLVSPLDEQPPLVQAARSMSEGVEVADVNADLAPTTSLVRYRILERLGKGGWGTVYKAEQRHPVKRVVAIKMITVGVDTPEVVARFESERQALARMDHPHIAKVFDAGSTRSGRPYFVMEYVPGEPITDFADRNRLTIPARLELFQQVCQAINHAHMKAVIHRDIKARNVLAYMHDGKPSPKVIDFGIAKALTGDRLTDQTFNSYRGQVLGTYESMSPEQASGSADIDTRTDVYSLGVLLYELLCGTKPFDPKILTRAPDEEIKRIIQKVDPDRPSTRLTSLAERAVEIAAARQTSIDALAKQFRQELEWIPLMAMRKERERRYASPLAISEDVGNYLKGYRLLAGPESTAYRIRKFVGRNKTVLASIAAVLVGVALVAGLARLLLHRQAQAHAHESAELREELSKALQPRPLAPGQNAPDPLSPALIKEAKFLLEYGDAEGRALAMIALNRNEEADRIIQELKSKPGNPIDEARRLLTIEGDNWYQQGQPDKAIEPYEKALALAPNDVQVRNDVVVAHHSARLGSISAHQQRAIELAKATLNLVAPGSIDWARTQINLGNAWADLPIGDRSENLGKAIAAYDLVLTVYTKEAHPREWATIQNNLGNAWADVPTGDRGQNLGKAIAAYDLALSVFRKETDPVRWARTQNALGVAWYAMETGDRGENLRKAIAAYDLALSVFTKEAAPSNWALTQNAIGAAWDNLPADDRGENQRKAFVAYDLALTVLTKETDPLGWAATQNNLAIAWAKAPTGDRAENLRKAIAAYESVLTVYTKEAYPAKWALTQNNLAIAWARLPTGDRADNVRKSISLCTSSLSIYTREAAPADWAWTHDNLARALAAMADLPGEDQLSWLARAIASDKAALLIFTPDAYHQRDHTRVQAHLDILRQVYEATGGPATRPVDTILPAD